MSWTSTSTKQLAEGCGLYRERGRSLQGGEDGEDGEEGGRGEGCWMGLGQMVFKIDFPTTYHADQ